MKNKKFQNKALRKGNLDKISSGNSLTYRFDKDLSNKRENFEKDREMMRKWIPHFLDSKNK